MMSSMYSAISALKANQMAMDVIGNNVANVNTVGFKSSTVTFSDVLSQTLSPATAADMSNGTGGTNPMQVGLGVKVSSINTLMTAGSLQLTGNPTDFAINGEGFFVVSDGNQGSYMFTRAGNFGIDEYGNLVTADGMMVCGYMDYGGSAQPDGSYLFDTEQSVEPINIFSDQYNNDKQIIAPEATKNVDFTGNLDASEEARGIGISDIGTVPESGEQDFSAPITVYDELGNEYEINVNFTKCFVDESDPDNPITSWYWDVPSPNGTTSTSGYIKFDDTGQIITGESDFEMVDDTEQIITEESGFETVSELSIIPNASDTGAGSFNVILDFNDLSMFSYNSSAKAFIVDGYPSGELIDFNIGADGIIQGIYSNGQQQPLGMIGLAEFDNPAGLESVGNNLYISTANSGNFTTAYTPGTGGTGSLSVGYLEMSNVDLAREFNNMIITQKGFQANSRVITTVDEMLDELINLKR